ncbi:iron-containing alcohol dehydrogenase PsrA [Azoarcus olearius]|uniref:iron-containing alcohol dehydrogenase PsrA n=1 Tax=Azoarcus sp. (strain BH72) TaxID=418699 RepID=UPI000AC3729C|nr:iron-containing alcohol dehydrogenase PsrA [Azoarcus olearius]
MTDTVPLTAWSYHNPVRVVGAGLSTLAPQLPHGRRVLLVTSRGAAERGIARQLEAALPGRTVALLDDVVPNPDLRYLDETAARLRGTEIDLVIALGGGSVLDAGKVLALLLRRPEPDLLTQCFRNRRDVAWTERLPLVAIPTTAGTGAEVTPFATVWDHERSAKHSLATPFAYPDLAVLDAALTLTLPPEHTLYPALDALSHALESLWNRSATPVSRGLALQALALAGRALPEVLAQPGNLARRADMQHASLLAGMAISQTRTAVAHAISYPLTLHHGVPHGLACSFTLPTLLRTNLDRIAHNPSERLLLEAVLAMLDTFGLGQRLLQYLQRDDVRRLHGEMFTAERSNNYNGVPFADVAEIIDSALAQTGKD